MKKGERERGGRVAEEVLDKFQLCPEDNVGHGFWVAWIPFSVGTCRINTTLLSPASGKDFLIDLSSGLSRAKRSILLELKSRYRFSCLTELDVSEQCADPDLIRSTTTSSIWPCDMVKDTWFKIKVYIARRCKLPCCQEYTWPQEWARRRQFSLCKKQYMLIPNLTPRETEAIHRWSDVINSAEWRDGDWNEKGILGITDSSKFPALKVTWSVMEEHLATLAYNDKKQLVFLAARICVEALAKNRGMYTYSQQYWGFARICTDLLKSPYSEVQEGILHALQLYLRTLKIFHSCFSHKCTEYASAGLFPVLLDLLEKSSPKIQAVIMNILVLMGMHAPYITLISNMGGLSALIRLADTSDDLLMRRVHACLEVVSKHTPVQAKLIEEGVLPLAVRHFSPEYSSNIQLNCLFVLNSLCHNHGVLVKTLAVDNYAIVRSVMRVMSEWTSVFPTTVSPTQSQNLNVTQIQNWCSLPRQNLILLCKLCVDECACKAMVKKGLVLKLKGVWYSCPSGSDRTLVMDALAIMSRFTRPAEKICYEGFLHCFTETLSHQEHREQVLEVALNLGKRHLPLMLEAGLIQKIVTYFGDKEFSRRLYPNVLSILSAYSSIDKIRDLLLENEGKAYTLILDTAFLTNDFSVLQNCIAIVSKLHTSVVPSGLLKTNTFNIVAYIDKLLKTGPDGLVLHGLMQLQDYLKVDFLFQSFREHHIHRVVEILCHPPYKPPVQYMAGRVLETLTGVRSRRSGNFESCSDEQAKSGRTKSGELKQDSKYKGSRSHDKLVREKLLLSDDDDEDEDVFENVPSDGRTACEPSVRLNIISATDDEEEAQACASKEDIDFEIVSTSEYAML
nr:hypothetical protein BgiMline_014215 [Biomphalaria glabrata]